ncbi:MAG: hypothetical protein V5A68_00900 [Candidatus Thermoplasmatota archaeon]
MALNNIKRYTTIAILSILFISTIAANAFPTEQNFPNTQSLEDLQYRQEIKIPINTGDIQAKNQPIDIEIKFKNPCWGKNENEHSIRIAYEKNSNLNEIESQVYNLKKKSDTQITGCNVVFLIPQEADGNEKYYVLYDSKETSPPNYKDHVKVQDNHYFYEPIPGQKINFDYYGIKQNGNIIYAIVQKGELLGNPISQSIIKFKPGSKVVETYNQEQIADFDMRYTTKEQPGYIGSSWATQIEKEILIDGNLMVRVRIKGKSPKEDIETDNIITYYYCPEETKRIKVNLQHRTLKKINIPAGSVLDGTFSGMTSIKSRSATIEKMNIGQILPILNIYSENDIIKKYSVPSNPSSEKREPILSTEDDIDLGKNAWISLSNNKGKTHSLIYEENTVNVNGKEEEIQIKAYTKQNVKLPGIEADSGSVYLMRNAYETGEKQNLEIPKGYQVNLNAEFVTFEEKEERKIDRESEIFQKITKNMPILRKNQTEEIKKEKEKTYKLKASVHMAPSIPMGSLFSAGIGKNISYIYAELYENNEFRSSGTVNRLPITSIELDFENKNFLEKIKTTLGIFDWKNISFFKKITFPEIKEGEYFIKIFKENPFFAKERQYIGFKKIHVEKNTSTNIFCSTEGKIELDVQNQKNTPLDDTKFSLYKGNTLVSEQISNKDGIAIIKAPTNIKDNYKLKVFYKGFLIEKKDIKLRYRNRFFQLQDSFEIETYNLRIRLKDKWGLKPEVKITPLITSPNMVEKITIKNDGYENDEYYFEDLYREKYVLALKYKSFKTETTILLEEDEIIKLDFPAKYTIKIDTKNSHGLPLEDGTISITRKGEKEKQTIKKGTTAFSIPPGEYEIKTTLEGKTIAIQKTEVKSKKEIQIITKKSSDFHNYLLYLGIAIIIFAISIGIIKKDKYLGGKIVSAGLILMSVVTPWWILNGENSLGTTTNIKTLIMPPEIVTLTTSNEIIGGNLGSLPSEVTMIFSLLPIILVIAMTPLAVTIHTKIKENKNLKFCLEIFSITLLILSLIVFYFVMSMVAEIGVGSFFGSGSIETNVPGIAESEVLKCNWGPGIGFYICIFSILILSLLFLFPKVKKIFLQKFF